MGGAARCAIGGLITVAKNIASRNPADQKTPAFGGLGGTAFM